MAQDKDKEKDENNPYDIDENFVISSFKNKERRNNPSPEPRALLPPDKDKEKPPEEKEEAATAEEQQEVQVVQPKESGRKKKVQTSYKDTFIRKNEIKIRDCVYISHDIHTKIARLIKILEDADLTIGGYVDIVLMEHLELHKDEINEIYRQAQLRGDLL